MSGASGVGSTVVLHVPSLDTLAAFWWQKCLVQLTAFGLNLEIAMWNFNGSDVQKVSCNDLMVLPGLLNKSQENKFHKRTFRDIFSSLILLIWQYCCVPINYRYVRLMKDCRVSVPGSSLNELMQSCGTSSSTNISILSLLSTIKNWFPIQVVEMYVSASKLSQPNHFVQTNEITSLGNDRPSPHRDHIKPWSSSAPLSQLSQTMGSDSLEDLESGKCLCFYLARENETNYI